jgi:hypothetical protein
VSSIARSVARCDTAHERGSVDGAYEIGCMRSLGCFRAGTFDR